MIAVHQEIGILQFCNIGGDAQVKVRIDPGVLFFLGGFVYFGKLEEGFPGAGASDIKQYSGSRQKN